MSSEGRGTVHSHTLIRSVAISVTGRDDLLACETLRIPTCVGNRLTDGGVILTSRFCSTPKKHYFSPSGIHSC
jgi:hypothetical protein